MEMSNLGKIYKDTEIIIKQGEQGECMYVIQDGLVEVVKETDQGEVQLALRRKGDVLGEMALFDKGARSATVRAIGEARVLTIDKKNLMRRFYEDPSQAFHLVQTMASRMRELSTEISLLRMNMEDKVDQPG